MYVMRILNMLTAKKKDSLACIANGITYRIKIA